VTVVGMHASRDDGVAITVVLEVAVSVALVPTMVLVVTTTVAGPVTVLRKNEFEDGPRETVTVWTVVALIGVVVLVMVDSVPGTVTEIGEVVGSMVVSAVLTVMELLLQSVSKSSTIMSKV
jgi:RsiW-degrading membrane proteinase PrsW (M82 family)